MPLHNLRSIRPHPSRAWLRRARPGRLAALDSADRPRRRASSSPRPTAPLIAARSVVTGEVIADPFRPSADVVALLELHGRSVAPRRSRRGLAERMGLRAGRVVSHTA